MLRLIRFPDVAVGKLRRYLLENSVDNMGHFALPVSRNLKKRSGRPELENICHFAKTLPLSTYCDDSVAFNSGESCFYSPEFGGLPKHQ